MADKSRNLSSGARSRDPLSRNDVSPTWVRDLAARCARVVREVRPSQQEGAGKAGCWLAPAVSCARDAQEYAHEHTGISRGLRPSLRNGFTVYAALSPATNSSCHRRRRIGGLAKPGWAYETSADLTPATGARTTRFCRTRLRRSSARLSIAHGKPPCDPLARRRCRVHRIPAQRMRRSRYAPLRAGMTRTSKDDLPDKQSGKFFETGLDTDSPDGLFPSQFMWKQPPAALRHICAKATTRSSQAQTRRARTE